MPWYKLYEELEQLIAKECGGRLVLACNEGTGYYVSVSVFGEPDKDIITKCYSSKEIALESALDTYKDL